MCNICFHSTLNSFKEASLHTKQNKKNVTLNAYIKQKDIPSVPQRDNSLQKWGLKRWSIIYTRTSLGNFQYHSIRPFLCLYNRTDCRDKHIWTVTFLKRQQQLILACSQWKVAKMYWLALQSLSTCHNSKVAQHIFMKFYTGEVYYSLSAHAYFG
jgi:hypothetical protein